MLAARFSSLRAFHGALLQRLRLLPAQPGASWGVLRAMSGEAHAQGTYLDRSQVVGRVLSVLKSNGKVNPAKVRAQGVWFVFVVLGFGHFESRQWDYGHFCNCP